MARSYNETKRYKDAEKCIEKSIEIKPRDDRYEFLGIICNALGKLEKAEHAYRMALDMDPSSTCAAVNLAALIRSKAPEESRALLENVFAIDPDNVGAKAELGYLMAQHYGCYHEGVGLLNDAILSDFQSCRCRVLLGTILWSHGDNSEAERELTYARTLAPEKYGPARLLGEFYVSIGRKSAARRHFRDACRLAPDGSREERMAADRLRGL